MKYIQDHTCKGCLLEQYCEDRSNSCSWGMFPCDYVLGIKEMDSNQEDTSTLYIDPGFKVSISDKQPVTLGEPMITRVTLVNEGDPYVIVNWERFYQDNIKPKKEKK